MPFIASQGSRIYYRLEGRSDLPLLVLVHALGTDHGLWDPQLPALLRYFQVLRLDLRGHGASDAPAAEYTIPQLAGDVLDAIDAVGREQFAYCGLSLGGMIGQWLAAKAPGRFTHLVLANTSPRVADPSLFEARRRTALEGGMSALADVVMPRFFSARMLSPESAIAASARTTLLATDPTGYAGCCAAIRDMDHVALLGNIRVPTLVISGDQDVSTPWTGHGDVLANTIAGARSVLLPAAHLSNLERPGSFTAALLDFLLPASPDPLAAGFTIRRRMLGDVHVDRAIANTSEFTRDFQDLITRYAWGTIWTRPALDPRIRRLLVLAITASLGRSEEFRLHVHTGLANELETVDLEEVLMQVAVYAGVPAANSAFRIASDEGAR